MPTFGWILLAIGVIALVIAIAVLARRGGSHTSLRRRFGPEYDRALTAHHGDRRAAEQHLADIARRRDELTISPLDPAAHDAFSTRWETLQARFVDDPGGATTQADLLISEVMRTRGYPADTFEERADILSADDPRIVGRYHEAREHAAGTDTENLRSAFVRYRELFGYLLGDTGARDGSADARDGMRPVRARAGASAAPHQRQD